MTTQTILAGVSRVRNATIDDVHAIVNVTNRAFVSEKFLVTGDRTDTADILQRFATGVFFVADDPADNARLLGSVAFRF